MRTQILMLGMICAAAARTRPFSGSVHPPPQSSALRESLLRRCTASHRRVTFSLPDTEWAGGFGDRLLGLATTYYVSVMTLSGLDVNWTRPYDLRNYFSVVDCGYLMQILAAKRRQRHAARLTAETVASMPLHLPPQASTTRTIAAVDAWSYFVNGAFLQDMDRDINIMTNGRHWQDVAMTPAVKHVAMALGIADLNRMQLFRLAIDAMLAPRLNVVTAAQAVLNKLGGGRNTHSIPFYVGVQIRCGSHGILSWHDPTRHSLADMPCFVAEALAACGSRSPCPIFLTADSSTAVNAFRMEMATRQGARNIIITEADGPILHTDRNNATEAAATGAADPWLRSVVDWWLLKHASALVISRSGFGETAAWVSVTNARARRIELGQLESRRVCNVTDFDAASVF